MVASLIRRISFETVTIGSLILGEMRPSSSFMEKFSDRVLDKPISLLGVARCFCVLRLVVSKVVSIGVSLLYLDGSYRTGTYSRATHAPFPFHSHTCDDLSFVPGANRYSLNLGGVSISMLNL